MQNKVLNININLTIEYPNILNTFYKGQNGMF